MSFYGDNLRDANDQIAELKAERDAALGKLESAYALVEEVIAELDSAEIALDMEFAVSTDPNYGVHENVNTAKAKLKELRES